MFDFGGVLITSINSQLGDVAATHGVDLGTIKSVLMGPPTSGGHPWQRAERGEIAVADIQGGLGPWAADAGISLIGDEIDRLLAAGGYSTVDRMIERIEQLRRDGFATALLTNTFAEFRPTMQRDLDFDSFDVVIESFSVGARKPEPAIYEATERGLGATGAAILYLDDFSENLVVPEQRGWRTILVGDHDEALAELDRATAP